MSCTRDEIGKKERREENDQKLNKDRGRIVNVKGVRQASESGNARQHIRRTRQTWTELWCTSFQEQGEFMGKKRGGTETDGEFSLSKGIKYDFICRLERTELEEIVEGFWALSLLHWTLQTIAAFCPRPKVQATVCLVSMGLQSDFQSSLFYILQGEGK